MSNGKTTQITNKGIQNLLIDIPLLFSGLLAGVLCSIWSARVVSVIGILISATGYIISAQAHHLGLLILGYGLFVGKCYKTQLVIEFCNLREIRCLCFMFYSFKISAYLNWQYGSDF